MGDLFMRAYVLEGFDVPPKMIEMPTPEVGAGDVLVRVHASSVNPHDAHVISGSARQYMEYRFPVILGSDVAGTVEEVGVSVTRFARGDRVFGLIREPILHRGPFAEFVAIPADRFVVSQPANLGDLDAGSLGLASAAALACLDAVAPSRGTTLLINGATGGVGSCAVEIAAALGVCVIATARAGDEERHVRELGATDVVDWSAGDVGVLARDLHPAGIDCVIDLVNHEPAAFARLATTALRRGGRAASSLQAGEAPPGSEIEIANIVATAELATLERIAELAAAETLHGHVKHVFAFEEIEAALAALAAGAVGKIALRMVD
jgi:NADPH:quinone reductase-like Zn-dependent oxidoreductase